MKSLTTVRQSAIRQEQVPAIFRARVVLLENSTATAIFHRLLTTNPKTIGREDLAIMAYNARKDVMTALMTLSAGNGTLVREFVRSLPAHALNGQTAKVFDDFLGYMETCMEAAVRLDPSIHRTQEPGPLVNAATYPSIRATALHRLGHIIIRELRHDMPEEQQGVIEILPIALRTQGVAVTGIDIHPGAQIGQGLFIDHGLGTVIGGTAEIGDGVTMFHGITLGTAVKPWKSKPGERRHPKLEDGVVVFSDAKIFGPVTIGKGSIVGAKAVVTKDLPPNSKVIALDAEKDKTKGPAEIVITGIQKVFSAALLLGRTQKPTKDGVKSSDAA